MTSGRCPRARLEHLTGRLVVEQRPAVPAVEAPLRGHSHLCVSVRVLGPSAQVASGRIRAAACPLQADQVLYRLCALAPLVGSRLTL